LGTIGSPPRPFHLFQCSTRPPNRQISLPGGRGRWRGSGVACAWDQGAGSPTAPRSGAPGLPGNFFRTGIVTQREPRRIKIPAFGKKMRRTSPHSFAVGAIFICARWRAGKKRPNSRGLARFDSIRHQNLFKYYIYSSPCMYVRNLRASQSVSVGVPKKR
jgi:hypothetical protein